MGYRIALHSLAALWNFLIMACAISLRKNHRYYKDLAFFSFLSGLFSIAWILWTTTQTLEAARFTWVGLLGTAAFFNLLWTINYDENRSKWHWAIWAYSGILFLAAISPWCVSTVSDTGVVYGPLEPIIRIGLGLFLIVILWALSHTFLDPKSGIRSHPILFSGLFIYTTGALFVSCILPLMGNQQYIETSSYGSVLWTSFAAWHVVNELSKHSEALTELNRLKRDFINQVTHEFRTPLNVIESALDVLRTRPGDHSYMDMISQNVDRLRSFIDDLLELAALQQNKVTLYKNEVSVAELIKKSIDLHRALAEKNFTKIETAGNSSAIFCDEERIGQTLSNLLSNAIKYTPNGRILITTQADEKDVAITIQDNGIGIDPSNLKEIFSSFYRIQKQSKEHKGSGLGLAIAKGWVEAHGGKIWAESEGEGKGTTVTFTLPVG